MRIRAVIFDMDGLMLDTEPAYRMAWKQASAACGFALTDEVYRQLVGRSRKDGFQALANLFGSEFPLQDFEASVQRHETITFSKSPISKKPGLDALLVFLETRNMPKAVATSTERYKALQTLTSTGLLERFDAVVTGDEVARGKPFPDIFLLAAQRLGVQPGSCLVLEDAESGVAAAHQACMQVYMVPDLVAPSDEIRRLTDGIFTSLDDVLKVLEHAARSSPGVGIDLQSFRTERLDACPLCRVDGPELADMHRNSVVMATLGGVKSEDEANQWLSANLSHRDRRGFGIWIFRDARDGHFVGRGGLREVEVGGGWEVELGYALLDKFWGLGFASEMARELLKIAFERFQLQSVVAIIAAENSRSRRVAEKMGFQFECDVTWKNLPARLYRLRRQERT
ncbi:MAG TPA: GNAT family N-acetyltransferase [Candidatus Acidoferrales bacterium]|nr:GNAT family N-acetyltransferase [Candidatus Acidoferrales bacterium]